MSEKPHKNNYFAAFLFSTCMSPHFMETYVTYKTNYFSKQFFLCLSILLRTQARLVEEPKETLVDVKLVRPVSEPETYPSVFLLSAVWKMSAAKRSEDAVFPDNLAKGSRWSHPESCKKRAGYLSSILRIAKKKAANFPVEAALFSWVNSKYASRRCVNSLMLNKKAAQLQQEINLRLPIECRTNLKLSNGWLHKFQGQYGLHSFKFHGEAGNVDDTAIGYSLPRIQRIIARQRANDVFNANEFGHFYSMAPDRKIAQARLPGRKKQKGRLTYLAICNATGKECIKLMVIGNICVSAVLQKKLGSELGFDFQNNRKEWMIATLLSDCLYCFLSYVLRTDLKRNILVLLENCSAHENSQTLPQFENVIKYCLPPNTTLMLQPLDACIILMIQLRYCHHQ